MSFLPVALLKDVKCMLNVVVHRLLSSAAIPLVQCINDPPVIGFFLFDLMHIHYIMRSCVHHFENC